MKMQSIALCAVLSLVAGSVAGQEAKKDSMSKEAMKPMTMQECKDYTAMAGKDATKKDSKKDTLCADMMKKEGGMMKSDSSMKKDAAKK